MEGTMNMMVGNAGLVEFGAKVKEGVAAMVSESSVKAEEASIMPKAEKVMGAEDSQRLDSDNKVEESVAVSEIHNSEEEVVVANNVVANASEEASAVGSEETKVDGNRTPAKKAGNMTLAGCVVNGVKVGSPEEVIAKRKVAKATEEEISSSVNGETNVEEIKTSESISKTKVAPTTATTKVNVSRRTVNKRAQEMVESYASKAKHNLFITKLIDEEFANIVRELSKSHKASVAAVRVNFVAMYEKIAMEVYNGYHKKFMPEDFNRAINMKLSADSRLGIKYGMNGVHIDYARSKNSSRAVKTKLYWLDPDYDPEGKWYSKMLAKLEPLMLEDYGEGILYWNAGVKSDSNFVRSYLWDFFNSRVLSDYLSGMKFQMSNSEYATYDMSRFVYCFSERILKSLELKAIQFWADITPQKIVKYFKMFATQQELTLEYYGDIGFLLGNGKNLRERYEE